MGRSNMSKSIADAVTGRDRDEERQRIRKAINAIVDGVGILQQLKMGALIVFERQTKLGRNHRDGHENQLRAVRADRRQHLLQ